MNNNPIQGSRFIGMNTMNNTLNKEDFLNNNNNESNDLRNNYNNEKINCNSFNSLNLNCQNSQNQNPQNLRSNNEIILGKFFIIKSINEEDIILSINFKKCCSTKKSKSKVTKCL